MTAVLPAVVLAPHVVVPDPRSLSGREVDKTPGQIPNKDSKAEGRGFGLHIRDGVSSFRLATGLRQNVAPAHVLFLVPNPVSILPIRQFAEGLGPMARLVPQTVALYDFITSEQYVQLVRRVEERTNDLLKEQEKEVRWHEAHWRREGEALRSIQKAEGRHRKCCRRHPWSRVERHPRVNGSIVVMTNQSTAPKRPHVVGLQERRLDRTILRTYRSKVDIDELVPNPKQPRLGLKEDEELQRQIEANEGLFEPLLVEPHPDLPGKYRIIDGDRRWTNSRVLVDRGREQYRQIPVEVTDRTLSEEERLRRLDLHPPSAQGMGRQRKGNGCLSPRRSRGTSKRRQYTGHHRARTRQARGGVRVSGEIYSVAGTECRDYLGARIDGRQQEAYWCRP